MRELTKASRNVQEKLNRTEMKKTLFTLALIVTVVTQAHALTEETKNILSWVFMGGGFLVVVVVSLVTSLNKKPKKKSIPKRNNFHKQPERKGGPTRRR